MVASFSGRSVIVTAGTQGLGLETARLLAARGAEAITICGRNETRGRAAVAELEKNGARALFVPADLTDPQACFTVVDRAAQTFGRIDSLINCCGASTRGTLESTTPELWDAVFAVNVRSAFFMIQRAVPVMRSGGRGGTIVNVGSVAAHGGAPYITAYCAAKGALLVLTKNLAHSLRWDRIRVNALNMGWTATPGEHQVQTQVHGRGDDWLAQAAAHQPFGRLLAPIDVARALAFLASEESGLMTGSIVDFDQTVIGTADGNPDGEH